MADIKKVKVGTTEYDITAFNILDTDGTTLHSWSDITAMATAAKLNIIVVTTLPTASENTLNAIYLVADTHSDTKDYYDEYITLKSGTSEPYTYEWEKIGNTDVDLTGYVQKSVNYSAAAKSSGEHTHTVTGSVTIPTVNNTQKHLTASASGTALNTTTQSVPTSVSVGDSASVLGSATTFKVTGGALTGASVASKAADTFNGGEIASLKTGFYTAGTKGSAASFTQGSKASWSAEVSSAGVLSFNFTPNGTDSFTTNTPTTPSFIDVSKFDGGAVATYTEGKFTPNVLGTVSAISVTSNADANVTAVTGVTVGDKVDVIKTVSVKTQPTITLSDTATTGGVVFTSDVNVGTATATITGGTAASAGAHTHDVNVAK